MKNCVFCNIANKEEVSKIVYEDELVVAFLDIDPISRGHSLVIPKKHTKEFVDLDTKTIERIMSVAQRLAKVIDTNFEFDGIQIMASTGAFQDVPHFHLHVFGRKRELDIQVQYPGSRVFGEGEMESICKSIKASM
jgi:histidine triad (HIT) family protein